MRRRRNEAIRSAGQGMNPGFMSALINCNTIPEIRQLAPLPRDAQLLIDKAVVEAGTDRLVLVQDLLAAGLVYPVADPLSVMEIGWEKSTRSGYAFRTMLPDARGERQMPDREFLRVPLYITMDDFSMNIRTLRASRRVGAPLDTQMVSDATINVNEALEDAAWNGAGISVHGNDAPGVLDQDDINTTVYAGGEAWDVVGHTGEEIVADVQAMIDAAAADKYYGPFNLYLTQTYDSKLSQDLKAASDKTIRQRILELGPIKNIRVADKLPANRTALIQMTKNVIDMVVGQEPVEVSWEAPSGFRFFGVVMAIMVQRVKSDSAGGSGIVVGDTIAH